MTPQPDGPVQPGTTPLLLVKGDATEEEVAALVAVLQGLASAASAQATSEPEPASSWAAPARTLRATPPAGPGGWRASALPR